MIFGKIKKSSEFEFVFHKMHEFHQILLIFTLFVHFFFIFFSRWGSACFRFEPRWFVGAQRKRTCKVRFFFFEKMKKKFENEQILIKFTHFFKKFYVSFFFLFFNFYIFDDSIFSILELPKKCKKIGIPKTADFAIFSANFIDFVNFSMFLCFFHSIHIFYSFFFLFFRSASWFGWFHFRGRFSWFFILPPLFFAKCGVHFVLVDVE